MKKRTLPYSLALLLTAAACGPGEVVVTMEIEVPNPEGEGTVVRPLADVEVQLLPFDRDAVFDSLTAAAPTPEPQIPPELAAARDEVMAAQAEYDEVQRRWSLLRDTLMSLTETMEQYNRGEARYLVLFREFQDFESELNTVEAEMNRSFARFDSLQRGTIRASDSIRILQQNWADEAFADVGDIFRAMQRASGLDFAVDTTDANGVVRLQGRPGQYWVHSRYALTYTELYWNEPVTLQRGEPVQLRLTRENAEERPRL